MSTFSTDFAPPADPTGLNVEAVLAASVVNLTWNATSIPQVDFGGYRVYRSTDGGLTYPLLVLLPGVNDTAYSDYEAPLNIPLLYRLTQSNLDFESNPAEAGVSLEDPQWWIVVPGDVSLTFPVPKVRGAPVTSPKVQEVYSPIGRPGKLVVGDVVQNEDGELTFLVMPDNPGMMALMRTIQGRMEGYILLKAPDGSIFHVQFGSMTRAFTNVPGMQEIRIPFAGVS